VRALAISGGPRRSPLLPDVPTMAEAGFPQYKAVSWFGLLAPAGTPAAIVDQLSVAVGRSGGEPRGRHRAARPGPSSRKKSSRPAEIRRLHRGTSSTFIAKLVDEAGLAVSKQ